MAGIDFNKLVTNLGDFHFGELPPPPLNEKRLSTKTNISLPAPKTEKRTPRTRGPSELPRRREPLWRGLHEKEDDEDPHIFVDSPIYHDEEDGLPSWNHTHPAEKLVHRWTMKLLILPWDMMLVIESLMSRKCTRRFLQSFQQVPAPRWSVHGYDPDLGPPASSQAPQGPQDTELFFSPTSTKPAAQTDEAPTFNGLRVPRKVAGTVQRLTELEKEKKALARRIPGADMVNPHLLKRHEQVVIESWRSLQGTDRLYNVVDSRPLQLLTVWLYMRWAHILHYELVDGWPSEDLPDDMIFSANSTGAELAAAFETAMMSSSPNVIRAVILGFREVRVALGMPWHNPDWPREDVREQAEGKENIRPEEEEGEEGEEEDRVPPQREACLYGPLFDSTNRNRDWTGRRGGVVIRPRMRDVHL